MRPGEWEQAVLDGEHTTGYSRALSAGSWEAAAERDGVFVAALKWKLKTSVHIEMALMHHYTWPGKKSRGIHT